MKLSRNTTTKSDLLQNANRLSRLGKYQEAIALYEQAIDLNPRFSWFYYLLAHAYEKMGGNMGRAIEAYSKAIDNSPQSPWFFFDLSRVLLRQTNLEKAIKSANLGIEKYPKFHKNYELLGSIYLKKSDFNSALACYEKVKELTSDSTVDRIINQIIVKSKIRCFRLNCQAYYDSIKQSPQMRELIDQISSPINQLIARYNLKGKSLLSVGPGLGHEEYWFYQNKCSLTFVDVDESNSLSPKLKNLPADSSEKCLTFFLGNALDLPIYEEKEKFEICYFSGFTPETIWRNDVQEDLRTRKKSNPELKWAYSWPEDEKPFVEDVTSILSKSLKQGGLFIDQAYAGGISIVNNPHYLLLMRQQLQTIGIQLVEVFYFTKSPGIQLIIGLKGTEKEALEFRNSIENNPSITSFHGRSTITNTGITKGYDILRS